MTSLFQELINRTLMRNPDGTPSNDGGTTHFEHVLTFFSIALQINAKNILELGIRNGGSTFPLLTACKVLNGKLTSVDISSPNFDVDETLKPHWTFIKSDAIKFLESNQEKFDLIYVDDWHSYPHVKKELEEIDRISDEKTIILLHDLMGRNKHPDYFMPLDWNPADEWGEGGPYRAVDELDKNKWEWMTIPVNHGLTLLRKKGKVITK
jgi:predicted O-methyltransferase YrrM